MFIPAPGFPLVLLLSELVNLEDLSKTGKLIVELENNSHLMITVARLRW